MAKAVCSNSSSGKEERGNQERARHAKMSWPGLPRPDAEEEVQGEGGRSGE